MNVAIVVLAVQTAFVNAVIGIHGKDGNWKRRSDIHYSVDIRCRTEHDKISELHFTSAIFLFGQIHRECF